MLTTLCPAALPLIKQWHWLRVGESYLGFLTSNKFEFLISTKLLVVTRPYGCIFQRVHTLINDHPSDLRQGPLKGLSFLLLTDESFLSQTGMKSILYLSLNYLPLTAGQIICRL